MVAARLFVLVCHYASLFSRTLSTNNNPEVVYLQTDIYIVVVIVVEINNTESV